MTIRRTGAAALAALILLGSTACSTGPDAAETMDSLVDALNRGDVAAVKALAADPDRIADVTPDEPAKLTLRGEVQASQSDKSKATGVVSWDDGEEMASIPLVRTKEGWRADLGASLPQIKELEDGATLGDAKAGDRLLPGTYTVNYRSDIGEGKSEWEVGLGDELKGGVSDSDVVLRDDDEALPLIAQRAGEFLESLDTCYYLEAHSMRISSFSFEKGRTVQSYDACRDADPDGTGILDASKLTVDHVNGITATLKGTAKARKAAFVEYPSTLLGETGPEEHEDALRAEHGNASCQSLPWNLDDAVKQLTGYKSDSILCSYYEEADVELTGMEVNFRRGDEPLGYPTWTENTSDLILDRLYHGYVPKTEDAREKVENGLA